MKNNRIQKYLWEDIREDVIRLNPQLAKHIDAISPSHHHYFYKIRYYYGDEILKDGELQVPVNHHDLVNINDKSVNKEIKQDLSYSPIAVAFIMSKNLEVYAELEDRIACLAVLKEGTLFGLWETFNPDFGIFVSKTWNMTAGARSIFFLPKISDRIGHKRLIEKYGIRGHPPNHIFQEWHIFKEILKNRQCENPWYSDIIFFSQAWFNKQGDSYEWLSFKYYLLSVAWEQLKQWRNKMYAEIIWETFTNALVKRNIKPSQNQINILRHLLDIANGIAPGFRPAMNDVLAPINLLQKIYMDDYKLENYAPIFFQPYQYYGDETKHPVYFSLGYPSNINYVIKEKNTPSVISELRNIINLQDTIRKKISKDERPIFKTVKSIDYRYFHSEADKNYGIEKTIDILEYDKQFKMLLRE